MIPLNLKWSTRRWLFSIITTSILCSLVIISLLWILSVRKKAAKDINEFRVEAVNKQKKILRNEVYDALSFARFHMSAHENLPDSVIKNEVLNWLAMQHFGNAGYVFVNRLDGLALIFDGKRISGSKSIKNMTDPNGKKLFEMELNAAGKAGGDFIEYKFKKMGGEKLFPKISYINSLPEWGWIIGAGDYLDDLSNEVAMVEHNLKKCELKSIGSIFLLLILLTGLNFFFAHKVSTWLDKQFDSIKEFLINSSRNVRYLNLDFFRIQELYEIGDAGNKMVKELYEDLALERTGKEYLFTLNDLPEAKGDKNLLEHVWMNLLSNAIKYSNSKEHPEIRVEGSHKDKQIVYEIHDNGVGFNPKYTHKLFGVFQRLHAADEFEGNGVGLAIVKRIVEKHGGEVWAEGKVNQGASFYFSLPDV